MNALVEFPFKNMPIIVNLLEDAEVSVREIASATGMCNVDSTEVSDMLAFLTTFGRVESTEQGWIIHKLEEKAQYERFRKAFLKDVITLLSKLSINAKTVELLSQETNLSIQTVDSYLSFLKDITRLGVIGRCSTTYPTTWCRISE